MIIIKSPAKSYLNCKVKLSLYFLKVFYNQETHIKVTKTTFFNLAQNLKRFKMLESINEIASVLEKVNKCAGPYNQMGPLTD